MAFKISLLAATAMLNGYITELDSGATAPRIQVYDGAEPADTDEAVDTQVLLVEFVMPEPSFAAPADVSGKVQINANAIDPVNALEDGTAAWFRIVNADDNVMGQGSVSNQAGTGDLKVSSTAIVQGIEVSVVSCALRLPYVKAP